LGPSTDADEVLRKLFDAGVDVFRLNASHGTQDDIVRRIHAVRQLSAEYKTHKGILLDLQGPKIRLGTFPKGPYELRENQSFTITTQVVEGTEEIGSTTYPEFARDVKPGDPVLLADGSIQLRVLSTDGVAAKCLVVTGGPISDRKGINLPGVNISTPSLSKKDISDAYVGVEHGVDFFALSFVRSARDVLRLRHLLEEKDAKQPIIAKIEKPEGWLNLDSILEECEGVMVARGDLGVEMAPEKVPAIQKSIIERARKCGKFVITATQMLESMIYNAMPTRAEVSDVANAIYDGTSAVMLSAETSAGKYPVDAVKVMARIARETEMAIHQKGFADGWSSEEQSIPEIIADAAYHAARSAGVVALAVGTTSGGSARLLARYRPPVPIYAFTSSEAVAQQLSIVYGVNAIVSQAAQSTDDMLQTMERVLVETGRVQPGDNIVFVAGQPVNLRGSTNMLKLHRVSGIQS
jgi:pyruvate kinase